MVGRRTFKYWLLASSPASKVQKKNSNAHTQYNKYTYIYNNTHGQPTTITQKAT